MRHDEPFDGTSWDQDNRAPLRHPVDRASAGNGYRGISHGGKRVLRRAMSKLCTLKYINIIFILYVNIEYLMPTREIVADYAAPHHSETCMVRSRSDTR